MGTTGEGGGQGGLAPFVPLILMVAIFYFLLIRPQQRKQKDHRAMLAALQKGDSVVTQGGIHGKITGLTDTVITLEIADKVRIKVQRGYIAAKISGGETKE
jgi:preprotein translocase subunit YajC